ncbi:hypothetical protein [Herbaspirillum huttiense]|uniref:hypothetical protein n=1 Tax=Herbaspirillum huttiense TaxID=863372 RepID=UPI0039B0362A
MQNDVEIAKEKLIKDLQEKAKAASRLETAFLWGSEALYGITIFSSAIATILAALKPGVVSETGGSEALIIAAAVPGLCVAIDNRFKPRARSDWNADKAIGYERLIRLLAYEDKPLAEVSAEASQFEREMEAAYPARASALGAGA